MALWYVFSAFVVLLIASGEYYNWRTGVPTVASFPPARRKIVEILQREAGSPRAGIVDLGSGNGQLAAAIARAMPAAHVLGIEISPVPLILSKIRYGFAGLRNLAFRRVDFFTFDCSKTDAVIVFLTDNIIARVSEKLRRELKPGAVVVANETPLGGDWEPVAVEQLDFMKIKIYVYRA